MNTKCPSRPTQQGDCPIFIFRVYFDIAQSAYCSRDIFLQWRKHYRSEMSAAKRKQEGSHWSKITRAFLQREYCLSSLTCQGGAKKQRPRNYLSFNLLSLISTLARAYLNLAISSVGFVMAICVRFLLRVNICSSLAKT